MKNYNELFVNTFTKSQTIDDTFANISNKEGLAAGIQYLKDIGCHWLDDDSFVVYYTINQFTLKEPTDDLNKLLDRILGMDEVIGITKTDKNLVIKLKDYTLEVETFSKRNPKVVKLLPDIESIERNGTCYDKAYKICLGFKGSSNLVTGYNYGYTDKSKYLHSWVEVTIDGKEYVVDGTLNAMINKEGYYKLRKINLLTSIPKEQLINDLLKYGSIIEEMGLDVYYVFRDEIISDLDKNEKMFENRKIHN